MRVNGIDEVARYRVPPPFPATVLSSSWPRFGKKIYIYIYCSYFIFYIMCGIHKIFILKLYIIESDLSCVQIELRRCIKQPERFLGNRSAP